MIISIIVFVFVNYDYIDFRHYMNFLLPPPSPVSHILPIVTDYLLQILKFYFFVVVFGLLVIIPPLWSSSFVILDLYRRKGPSLSPHVFAGRSP